MRYIFLTLLFFLLGCSDKYDNSEYIDISPLFGHYSTFEAEDPFSFLSESMCFFPEASGDFLIVEADQDHFYCTWNEDEKINNYNIIQDGEEDIFDIEILAYNQFENTYIAKIKDGILSAKVLVYEGCPFE